MDQVVQFLETEEEKRLRIPMPGEKQLARRPPLRGPAQPDDQCGYAGVCGEAQRGAREMSLQHHHEQTGDAEVGERDPLEGSTGAQRFATPDRRGVPASGARQAAPGQKQSRLRASAIVLRLHLLLLAAGVNSNTAESSSRISVSCFLF